MPESNDVVRKAEEYYDSDSADRFYSHVWGGEDIHIGLYEKPDDDVSEASRRTVERMIAELDGLGREHRMLDIGAGYGGAARIIAKQVGCSVTCLNLSETQNARNQTLSSEQGLANRVDVVYGNFEELPFEPETFDFVWSQDAILHSGNRKRVLAEVVRVLKPGGELIFTDPMQADDVPDGVLQPVYDRIHLESLGSFGFYREATAELGMSEIKCIDLSHQLRRHYARVADVLRGRYDEMCELSGKEYVDRMLQGLQHWVDAADAGYLKWGILRFRKG